MSRVYVNELEVVECYRSTLSSTIKDITKSARGLVMVAMIASRYTYNAFVPETLPTN